MLYQPFTFKSGATMPNRIALAAMTNQQSHPDGTLSDDEYNWLARRADGGFGMIATCAANVALDGKAWPGELGIDRDDELPGLTRLATRLRVRGAVSLVQIFHGGVRAASALTGEQVWSASTWQEDKPGFETPRIATIADIERVIGQFGDAAMRAQRAGFDGVELHGAHGYLLSQFLSSTMNPRTDGWGGDLVGRARLVRECTRVVRERCGAKFTVGVRLSLEDFGNARGMDIDDNLKVAAWLADDGVDFIHISLWDVKRMSKKRPTDHPIALARAVLPKEVALIAAGGMWSRADAEEALGRGADAIALARAAIINPDWPDQAREPAWEAQRPPVARAELIARAVSPEFATYLKAWKNFIAD